MMTIATRSSKRRKKTDYLLKDASAAKGGGDILTTTRSDNLTLVNGALEIVENQTNSGAIEIAKNHGALEIAKNQFILDIKRKNSNLQKLSDEICEIYNHESRSSYEEFREDLRKLKLRIDDALQEYRKRWVQNIVFEVGPQVNVKDKTWCPGRDSYVYDPHVRGKASWYDKCSCSNHRCPRTNDDGAIHPALIQPTGEKALMIALDDTKNLKEWSLLEMKNYYLGAKVDRQIHQLCLNYKSDQCILNQNFPGVLAEDDAETEYVASSDEGEEDTEDDNADAAEEAESADILLEGEEEEEDNVDEDETSTDSGEVEEETDDNDETGDGDDEEENDDHGERLQTLLGALSAESLSHHMTDYNLDLRQIISNVYNFVGMTDCHFYAATWEFFQENWKEFMQQLKIRSLKILPCRGDIAFEPLQEMENLYLTEKLEHLVLLSMVTQFDKELFEKEFSELFSQHYVS